MCRLIAPVGIGSMYGAKSIWARVGLNALTKVMNWSTAGVNTMSIVVLLIHGLRDFFKTVTLIDRHDQTTHTKLNYIEYC